MDNSNVTEFSDRTLLQLVSDLHIIKDHDNDKIIRFKELIENKIDLNVFKNYKDSTTIIDILEKLEFRFNLTFDNFYVLVGSFSKYVIKEYRSCVEYSGYGNNYRKIIILDNNKFTNIFKYNYDNKYDDILMEVLSNGYFMSPSNKIFAYNTTLLQ